MIRLDTVMTSSIDEHNAAVTLRTAHCKEDQNAAAVGLADVCTLFLRISSNSPANTTSPDTARAGPSQKASGMSDRAVMRDIPMYEAAVPKQTGEEAQRQHRRLET